MPYTTLVGAEDVRSAGHQIADTASEMSRAAGYIDDALSRHRIWADEWMLRLEAVAEKMAAAVDHGKEAPME